MISVRVGTMRLLIILFVTRLVAGVIDNNQVLLGRKLIPKALETLKELESTFNSLMRRNRTRINVEWFMEKARMRRLEPRTNDGLCGKTSLNTMLTLNRARLLKDALRTSHSLEKK